MERLIRYPVSHANVPAIGRRMLRDSIVNVQKRRVAGAMAGISRLRIINRLIQKVRRGR